MFQFDDLDERRRGRIRQFVDLCRRHVAEYTVISADPIIFFMPIWVNLSHFLRDYQLLLDSLKDRKVFVLCSTYWYFERPENIDELKRMLDKFAEDYPRFTFTVLCNTPRQRDLFTERAIPAVFCTNNCFIDETLFFPIQTTEKRFDCVYDGRLVEWKRHDLSSQIDSLGLIYYAIPWLENNSYMKTIIREFSHAQFFNHDETGQYHKLTPQEVNRALNQCRVGLCLSAEEGAMYASVQYLLAGLPVVTTANVGGRDVFFDDEIAITVEPTPDAVARGVREMIDRDLDPHRIRSKTLDMIKIHRKFFVDLVQEIYEREGVARDFSTEWDSIFYNKLLRNLNHLQTVSQLKQIGGNKN